MLCYFCCNEGGTDQFGSPAYPAGPLPREALHDKDNTHMMVDDLAGVADDEIRSNQALRTLKLTLTALDLPHHGPLPQVWLSTRSDISLPNGAEIAVGVPLYQK